MTDFIPEMTNKEKNEARRARMTVCKNFLKGRCNYGSKCKFSHNVAEVASLKAEANKQRQNMKMKKKTFVPEKKNDEDDIWEGKGQVIQKKRVGGITDNVEPTKKAMKILTEERNTQRPWTMSKS